MGSKNVFTSPSLLITLLLVILVLGYTANLAFTSVRPAPSHAKAASDCVIPIYAPTLLYEFKWMFETVTSAITATCGCTLIMKDPEEFVTDFKPWKEGKQPGPPYKTSLFVFMRGAAEHGLWNDGFYREYFMKHAILFHTSDEFDDADTKYYPVFKRIYRNYYSDKTDRLSSLAYLQGKYAGKGQENAAQPNVKWMPMGPSWAFIYGGSLRLPFAKRPLLFFWAGSKSGKQAQGKQERAAMLASVQSNATLKARGKLHIFGYFQLNLASEELMGPLQYTRNMYSAKLVPCPSGVSADQFRIYESFGAGAIPIVRAGHTHLRYLDLLQLRHVTVPTFNDTATVLQRAAEDRAFQAQLAQWQAHNNERWDEINSLLAQDVADQACGSQAARD